MTTIHLAQDLTSHISQIISPGITNLGGLYLGNYQATKNKQVMKKYKITAVLSLMGEKDVELTQQKLFHFQIKIDDSPFENISHYFSECIEFIQKHRKSGNVFVHCVAGISRSATIVVAYLMKIKKYPANKALNKVKRRRNIVNPNKGFLQQLSQFQKQLQKQLKVKTKQKFR